MLTQTLRNILRAIPQQAQRQDNASDQLRDLREFANRLGMYDAADLIRNIVERSERSEPSVPEAIPATTQGPEQP